MKIIHIIFLVGHAFCLFIQGLQLSWSKFFSLNNLNIFILFSIPIQCVWYEIIANFFWTVKFQTDISTSYNSWCLSQWDEIFAVFVAIDIRIRILVFIFTRSGSPGHLGYIWALPYLWLINYVFEQIESLLWQFCILVITLSIPYAWYYKPRLVFFLPHFHWG